MLLQELGRLKRSSIMMAVIMMAVGVVMLICPDGYVPSLVNAVGYVLLVSAGVMVLEFISSRRALMDHVLFTAALALGLLGAAVLTFSGSVVRIIGAAFGVLLVAVGAVNAFNALMYARRSGRRGWWVLLVLSALQVLLGLVILVNPWWDRPRPLFEVIGGALLFSAAVSIARLSFLWPVRDGKGERS